jgi:type IV pilus assembly protein PilB
LDPASDGLRCRIRIDGVLHEVATFAKPVQQALLNRLKFMANVDLSEQKLPLSGRIGIGVGDRQYDLRLATLPSLWGEKMTVRLLDTRGYFLTLDKVDLSDEDMEKLKRALHCPTGMILFTGPTGSGKTTVMYGALHLITNAEKSIFSVEDPVEVALPGVTQVQVNPRAGLTYDVVLRQLQRSDPDVIMVGTIADLKTAEVCVQAAITGHLVLTTLHTHDAPHALIRLVETGIEPFMIAESVICVVSQRLARRVCGECAKPVELVPELLARVRAQAEAGGLKWPAKVAFRKGAGCPQCRGTGYRGRIAVFQVMPMTSDLSRLLVAGAGLDELRAESVRGGTKTLLADGIQKALDGITTVEEVLRVTTLQ